MFLPNDHSAIKDAGKDATQGRFPTALPRHEGGRMPRTEGFQVGVPPEERVRIKLSKISDLISVFFQPADILLS